MSSLALVSSWEGEEEPVEILCHKDKDLVAVLRPSLPPVCLNGQGRVVWSETSLSGALSGAWNRQGVFALGTDDGRVQVVDFTNGQRRSWSAPESWVGAVVWSPLGDTLAVAAGKTLAWWNPFSTEPPLVSNDRGSTISGLAWGPGPLAACGYGGVRIFLNPGQAPTKRLEWKGSSLRVTWSPNGQWIATSDQDKTVHLWPWPTGSDLMMGAFDAKSLSLAWSGTGSLLSTSGSSTLLLWDCRGKGPGGRSPNVGKQLAGLVTCVDSHRQWATVDDAGGFVLWDDRAVTLARISLDSPGVAVRWLGDDKLVTAEKSGRISFWRVV